MKFSAKKTPKVLTEIPRTLTSGCIATGRYSVARSLHLGIEHVGELVDGPEPELGLEEERQLDHRRTDLVVESRELTRLGLGPHARARGGALCRPQQLAPVAVERQREIL